MPITFVGAGALADNATTNTQVCTTHASTGVGDIIIAQLINKSVTANAFSPPDGTWTTVIATEVNDCTVAADDHQFGLYWKRSTADGAQGFTFSKATDDNVEFAVVLSSWRGARQLQSPIDSTAPARTKTAGGNVVVSHPAYDPTDTDVHAIFMAYYGNDATTASTSMVGNTNPVAVVRYDLMSGTGTDCSLCCASGDNDGSNIAARTWAQAPTASAGNTGVTFALVCEPKGKWQSPYRAIVTQ
jgi:hypothetical protein